MNTRLEATAAHVESHIESVRRTLSVVLEELIEAEIAPTNLETLIAALLCNGVNLQEIAFLINESKTAMVEPSLVEPPPTRSPLKVEEFKLVPRESVN